MKLQVYNRTDDDTNHFVRLNPATVAQLYEEALSEASRVDVDDDSWNLYQEDPKNVQFLPLCIKSNTHDIYCSYNCGFFPQGELNMLALPVEILPLLMNTF